MPLCFALQAVGLGVEVGEELVFYIASHLQPLTAAAVALDGDTVTRTDVKRIIYPIAKGQSRFGQGIGLQPLSELAVLHGDGVHVVIELVYAVEVEGIALQALDFATQLHVALVRTAAAGYEPKADKQRQNLL